MDVAQALTNLLEKPVLPRTLSLPGPSTLTYEYLLELVSSLTYVPPSGAPTLPKPVALYLAKLAQSVWWPALSPDEVETRYIDDVQTPGDWDAVGVVPDEIETHAIKYLRMYRSACVLDCFPARVLKDVLTVNIRSENYVRPIVFPPLELRSPSVSLGRFYTHREI